jgi:hypothetical protein
VSAVGACEGEERIVPLPEILWWLLLGGVLVWGWEYIEQFRR